MIPPSGLGAMGSNPFYGGLLAQGPQPDQSAYMAALGQHQAPPSMGQRFGNVLQQLGGVTPLGQAGTRFGASGMPSGGGPGQGMNPFMQAIANWHAQRQAGMYPGGPPHPGGMIPGGGQQLGGTGAPSGPQQPGGMGGTPGGLQPGQGQQLGGSSPGQQPGGMSPGGGQQLGGTMPPGVRIPPRY